MIKSKEALKTAYAKCIHKQDSIGIKPKELLKILSNFVVNRVKNYKLKGLSKEDKIRMNKKMHSRNYFIEKSEK